MSVMTSSGEDLDELASKWRAAREKERDLWVALKAAIAQAAREGVPEVQLVRRTGISRVTVRKAMGKDTSSSSAVDSAALHRLRPAGDNHAKSARQQSP